MRASRKLPAWDPETRAGWAFDRLGGIRQDTVGMIRDAHFRQGRVGTEVLVLLKRTVARVDR